MNYYISYLKELFKGNRIDISIPKHLLYSCITIFSVNALCNLTVRGLGIEQVTSISTSVEIFGNSSIFNILHLIILGPIFEELAFRLFLNPKKIHVLVSVSLLYSYSLSTLILFIFKNQIEQPLLLFGYLNIFLFIKCLGLMIAYRVKSVSLYESIVNLVQRNLKFVYFSSVILFAAFHIVWLEYYISVSLLANILLFIPYITYGLVYSHARVSIGFIYAILLHCGNNLLTLL